MFTEEDGTSINNENKRISDKKILKYTQFFNLYRALGRSVFKNYNSGI